MNPEMVCASAGDDPNDTNHTPLRNMDKFDFKLFEHLQKYFPKQEIKLNNVVDPKKLEGIKDLELVSEFLQDWWQFGSEADDLLFTADAAMQSGQIAHVDAAEGSTVTVAGYGNDRVVGDSRNNIIYGNNAYANGQAYVDKIDSFTDYSSDFELGVTDDDYLTGGVGNDVLYGCSGNDVLIAGTGNDTLFGGTGNDFLDAGFGNALLKGGDGADMFKINESLTATTYTRQLVMDMKDDFDRIKYSEAIRGEIELYTDGIRWLVQEHPTREDASNVHALVGRRTHLFSFTAMNGTSLAYDDKGIWVAGNNGDLNAMPTIIEGLITDNAWVEPLLM